MSSGTFTFEMHLSFASLILCQVRHKTEGECTRTHLPITTLCCLLRQLRKITSLILCKQSPLNVHHFRLTRGSKQLFLKEQQQMYQNRSERHLRVFCTVNIYRKVMGIVQVFLQCTYRKIKMKSMTLLGRVLAHLTSSLLPLNYDQQVLIIARARELQMYF